MVGEQEVDGGQAALLYLQNRQTKPLLEIKLTGCIGH